MVNAKLILVIFVLITVVTGRPSFNGPVRICYFNDDAKYGYVRFYPTDIHFALCTHYVYAYAIIGAGDKGIKVITSTDPSVEIMKAYHTFAERNKYKTYARNWTLLLSIGGPKTSQHMQFVELVQSEANMSDFCHLVTSYLVKSAFDGIDFDWQYPTTTAMRWGFAKLLEMMKKFFNRDAWFRNFLITVKLPAVYNSIAYDVAAITRYADYVMIAAYNLPTPNPRQAWFGSQLHSDHISVSSAVQGWLAEGLPAAKAVLGISPLGRFLRLESASAFTPGSPVRNEVLRGKHYKMLNSVAYSEICQLFENATKYHDPATEMNYLVSGTYWVGYEDKESIEAKINWVNRQGMAGVMVSDIDKEDFTGVMCNRGRFPLIQMIKRAMEKSRENTKPLGTGALKENKAHKQECSHVFTIALVCYLCVQYY